MDMDMGDLGDMASGEHGFVMRAAQGMTAAEAVEAIAEAAELRGITPTSVVLSHTTVAVSPSRLPPSSAGTSPSRTREQQEQGGEEAESQEQARAAAAASFGSMTMTPPRNPSPLRTAAAAATASAAASGSSGSRVREGEVIFAGLCCLVFDWLIVIYMTI